MSIHSLDMPDLRTSASSGIPFLTDDALFAACGVRIAFTGRHGGVSCGPYASLNLGSHVGDDADAVQENRRRIMAALGAADAQVVCLNQVHGERVVSIGANDPAAVERVRAEAADGADAIVVGAPDVAPLLCFADCVPVIAVCPTGDFAVAHAGWRGVVAGVAGEAVRALAELQVRRGAAPDAAAAAHAMNIYLGPHIGACCFQTGAEVRERFVQRFGAKVLAGEDRIDLTAALRLDVAAAGVDPQRIVDSGICTQCNAHDQFSYRASGGQCGRHAAIAVRHSEERTWG